nr:heavy metal transport/detoxification protein [Cytophagales bacterium]
MIKLKTNVKCGACVAAITPEMDALNASKWTVDLSHPDRILKVEGPVTEEAVKEALQKAGYKGESIPQKA